MKIKILTIIILFINSFRILKQIGYLNQYERIPYSIKKSIGMYEPNPYDFYDVDDYSKNSLNNELYRDNIMSRFKYNNRLKYF